MPAHGRQSRAQDQARGAAGEPGTAQADHGAAGDVAGVVGAGLHPLHRDPGTSAAHTIPATGQVWPWPR